MYGKCIVADYNHVSKDVCLTEFLRLKDCYIVSLPSAYHDLNTTHTAMLRRHQRDLDRDNAASSSHHLIISSSYYAVYSFTSLSKNVAFCTSCSSSKMTMSTMPLGILPSTSVTTCLSTGLRRAFSSTLP